MDGGDLLLGLRVALSLACVLGLMWYVGKRVSGNPKGMLRRRPRATAMAVVGRQSLGGKTGLALVEVGGRRLLLGVSERGVNLLTELEPEPAEATDQAGDDGHPTPVGPVTERVELDPALLEQTLAAVTAGTPVTVGNPVLNRIGRSVSTSTPVVSRSSTTSTPAPSTPAARKPAVPKPRNPLEGSILDAAMWRQAVVAVQERTIRH